MTPDEEHTAKIIRRPEISIRTVRMSYGPGDDALFCRYCPVTSARTARPGYTSSRDSGSITRPLRITRS
jgi:hypothetical protein